jgi:hypothetical protein
MEIRYVDSGLANNFGDYIELNKYLKFYPELHDTILKHELSHTNNKGFTKEDFLLDFSPSKVNYWKLFKFMCMCPKSFLQFAPFYKQGKTIVYDINMIIAWSAILGVIGITLFLTIG